MSEKRKRILSVIILCLVLIGAFIAALLISSRNEAAVCTITIHGEVYKSLSLFDDYEERIVIDGSGYNDISIHNGTVAVVGADCPNHICIDTGSISKSGQVISCIPHGLIITISNPYEEVDSVAY